MKGWRKGESQRERFKTNAISLLPADSLPWDIVCIKQFPRKNGNQCKQELSNQKMTFLDLGASDFECQAGKILQ